MQAVMARGALKEPDARELYREVTGSANGTRGAARAPGRRRVLRPCMLRFHARRARCSRGWHGRSRSAAGAAPGSTQPPAAVRFSRPRAPSCAAPRPRQALRRPLTRRGALRRAAALRAQTAASTPSGRSSTRSYPSCTSRCGASTSCRPRACRPCATSALSTRRAAPFWREALSPRAWRAATARGRRCLPRGARGRGCAQRRAPPAPRCGAPRDAAAAHTPGAHAMRACA
jgi:hypothetical protein